MFLGNFALFITSFGNYVYKIVRNIYFNVTYLFKFFLDFTRQDGNRIKKTHQVVPCVRMGTH